MNLQQLEYVVAVDAHRHFAKAADACFVTQPTLSMQIKKLEEEIGVIIFDRSKKPVMTTRQGRILIDQARIALREINRIGEIMQSLKDEIDGVFRIGIIPTLSPYLLPLFLPAFTRAYPKVELVIEEQLSEVILRKISQDQIDVGIMVAPKDMKGFRKQPLFFEEFLLYFSAQHPLTQQDEVALDELDLSELWLLKEGHCFRDQIQQLCSRYEHEDAHPAIRFESGSLETVKRMVEHNFGFTLLPQLAIRDIRPENIPLLRHFKNRRPLREVSLITARSFLKMKQIEALSDIILKCLPEEIVREETGEVIEWAG
ncbi:MAG: LysR substrate-binding domain-containing protein [Bacteroidia bacterium]